MDLKSQLIKIRALTYVGIIIFVLGLVLLSISLTTMKNNDTMRIIPLLFLIISIILFVLPGILILKVEVNDKSALEFKKNWIKKGFHLIPIFGSLLFCKKISRLIND